MQELLIPQLVTLLIQLCLGTSKCLPRFQECAALALPIHYVYLLQAIQSCLLSIAFPKAKVTTTARVDSTDGTI